MPGAPCEHPIDVAEAAEQVAVVVVARGDEWHSCRSGRDRAVDVRVHKMGVDQVRLGAAHRSDDVDRHPRIHVERTADMLGRDARGGQFRVEPSGIGARYVEPEKPRVHSSLTKRRKEGEQVPLGTADPGDLVDVQNPHGVSSSLR
jgi:hypothetical protein